MKPIFLLFLTVAGTCAAQTSDRVFYYAHTNTVQSQEEIATVMRTLGDIKQVTVDRPQSSVTVNGTKEQLALAGWIFDALDQPGPVQPGQEVRSFSYGGGGEDTVRAFYFTHGQTIQQFQEMATAIRTVAEIRRVFTYNAHTVMVIRGTRDQAEMAEWLVHQLDIPIPATKQHAASAQFETPVNGRDADTLLRVFYAGSPTTVQAFQELATLVRSIGKIRRVFTYNALQAIVVRTDSTGMGIGQWLFDDLDQPANRNLPTHEFRPATAADDVVRVFYLSQTPPQNVDTVVKQITAGTNMKFVSSANALKAIAARGTGSEIARANQIVTASN